MNDQSPERDATESTVASLPVENGSSQNRRRLLRAFGAGSALAGAGLPFSAFGETIRPHCKKIGDTSTNYHPTASLVGSLVGSVTGSAPQVNGHKCSAYKVSSCWGTGWTNGGSVGLTWDKCANPNGTVKLRFWEVFNLNDPGSGPKSRFCHRILSDNPPSEESIWLAAMFNANKFKDPITQVGTQTVGKFTYDPQGVIALYANTNPLPAGATPADLKARAVTLFRDYLSQLPDPTA